jgi:selenocysteine lyase/cysteine desulfurase
VKQGREAFELEEQPDFSRSLRERHPQRGGNRGLWQGGVLQEEVRIRVHEMGLTQQLLQGLLAIPGVVLYGPRDARKQLSTVSFNIQGIAPSEVGLKLDEEFGILCRVGLHCSPASHRTLGTFPQGTVRFGLSYFNREEEIEEALQAVSRIARREA